MTADMFVNDFNPATALAAAHCPRCRALGLVAIDSDAYDAAPLEHRHQATAYISPSLTAQCPACRLVMEWPGCC